MGNREVALLPTARISGFSPHYRSFDLPFLSDRETAYEIFDNEVGEKLLDTLGDAGVKGLAIYEDGFKHFTCSKSLRSWKISKALNSGHEEPDNCGTVPGSGANPVPIDFSELYNALQLGKIRGRSGKIPL